MLSTIGRRCALSRVAPITSRALLMTTARAQSAKTPIQEWGWQYLLRQKQLKRPISPHLTIYKPMMTWSVSGFHRITGCVMACAGTFAVAALLMVPFDYTDCVRYVKSWNLPRPIIGLFKFIICYPIVFHSLNGARFIGFDMAKFLGTQVSGGVAAIYRGAYFVLGVAAVISIYIAWFMPTTLPCGAPIEQKKAK